MADGALPRGSAHARTDITSQTVNVSFVGFVHYSTGPVGAVVMASANGLVGTGFASRYRLQLRSGF